MRIRRRYLTGRRERPAPLRTHRLSLPKLLRTFHTVSLEIFASIYFSKFVAMHPGMPFFANPFISPFMPQQPADVPAATATASPSSFVFSPAQYQEMMQQYFQQMMMASQFGHTMPFPMPFGAQLPVRPASQVRWFRSF